MLSPNSRRRKEQSHSTTGDNIQTSPHCLSGRKVLKWRGEKSESPEETDDVR